MRVCLWPHRGFGSCLFYGSNSAVVDSLFIVALIDCGILSFVLSCST